MQPDHDNRAGDSMDLASQVRTNRADINALTIAMAKVVTSFEYAEEWRKTFIDTVKAQAETLKELTERTIQTQGVSTELAYVKEQVHETKEKVRLIGHDVKTLLNGLGAISVVNEKVSNNSAELAAIKAKQEALEKEQDKHAIAKSKEDGARGAYKSVIYICWTVFGSAILGFGGYAVDGYFKYKYAKKAPVEQTQGVVSGDE